jgi:hypothetical protein
LRAGDDALERVDVRDWDVDHAARRTRKIRHHPNRAPPGGKCKRQF